MREGLIDARGRSTWVAHLALWQGVEQRRVCGVVTRRPRPVERVRALFELTHKLRTALQRMSAFPFGALIQLLRELHTKLEDRICQLACARATMRQVTYTTLELV